MERCAIPAAIQWHEGMLLAPQHFQQATWRQEALLHYHTTAMAPFHWGIHRLHIDPLLLMHGTLRVVELEALMPDGLVVMQTPQQQSALELDLLPYTEEMRQSPRMIYLVVPEEHPSAYQHNGELRRYESVEGEPVVDCYSGASEICIPRLIPRLGLVCSDAPPPRQISVPLAQVRYQNEIFTMTDFLPPMYTVPRQSPLAELCTVIAKRLREKAMFLAERVQSPAVTPGAPLVLETQHLIHSLVAALPPFEALLATGVAHPYPLYLALCGIVGQMAGVGTSLLPPALGAYNHDDLRATYAPAQEFILRALDEGVHEDYTTHPFHYEHSMFGLAFEAAWLEARLVLGVRGQMGMSERDILSWMEGCVIGSSSVLPSLRERRVLGAARQSIERDEQLVPARGVSLFSLVADPLSIQPHEPLHIFNTASALRPAEIVLYVRRTR
ncbi:MAG: type VI secretion system baseplate subunit TssK [Candidatus Tectimicrobiota bacterium]